MINPNEIVKLVIYIQEHLELLFSEHFKSSNVIYKISNTNVGLSFVCDDFVLTIYNNKTQTNMKSVGIFGENNPSLHYINSNTLILKNEKYLRISTIQDDKVEFPDDAGLFQYSTFLTNAQYNCLIVAAGLKENNINNYITMNTVFGYKDIKYNIFYELLSEYIE